MTLDQGAREGGAGVTPWRHPPCCAPESLKEGSQSYLLITSEYVWGGVQQTMYFKTVINDFNDRSTLENHHLDGLPSISNQ